MDSFHQPARLKSGGASVEVAPPTQEGQKSLGGAFFWLSAFYLVYCSRPEDWIPGLAYVPMAKISGIFAILGIVFSVGKTKRGLRDLPREATYLLMLIALMVPAALLSPVWKGGALLHTLDFSKVYVAWVLTFLLVTDLTKLRRIIFIQAGSVAVISVVSAVKGHGRPRLEGVLGGIYSNPNDLAFAIVLSLPFCLAFMLSARDAVRKAVWALAMLVMLAGVFLTGSRGGFITLVVSGVVVLWYFGVRGGRWHLIAVAVLAGALLLGFAGGVLRTRFNAIAGGEDEYSAYGSYEARRELMISALKGIARYPLLGIGVQNFIAYSGTWREVHVAYLQLAVEAGLPALVLYLLFFARGFMNLRKIGKIRNLDPETKLFAGALNASLIGFMTGACFSPEAYQFFPYFAVAYTSVLLAIASEKPAEAPAALPPPLNRFEAKKIFAHLGNANEPMSVR